MRDSTAPLIVTGFHRSGTSMLAQALAAAGLDLGDRVARVSAANREGYFEDARVVALHASALHAGGLDWTATSDTPVTVDQPLEEEFRRYAVERAAEGCPWGFKDPRACLFLPFWRLISPGCQVVAIYRHYWECTESLLARHSRTVTYRGMPDHPPPFWRHPTLAPRMWIAHNRALVAYVKAHRDTCLVVSQPALLRGFPVVREVSERFGVALRAASLETIKAEYATAQRVQAFELPAALLDELESVWNELQALAGPASAPPGDLTRCAWHGNTDTTSARARLRAACQALVRDNSRAAVPAAPASRKEFRVRARACLQEDPDEARRWYEAGLARYPDDRQLTCGLADALVRAGESGQAETLLRALVVERDPPAQVLTALGSVLRSQGRNQEARACWERVLHLPRVPAEIHARLAALALDEARFADAEQLVTHGLSLHPGNNGLVLLLSEVCHGLGRGQQAVGVLEQAIGSGARDPRLFRALARLLLRADQLDEAVRVVNAGLELHPRDAGLTGIRRLSRERAGDAQLALDDFWRESRYAFEKRDKSPSLIAAASRVSDPAARLDLLERMIVHVRQLATVQC